LFGSDDEDDVKKIAKNASEAEEGDIQANKGIKESADKDDDNLFGSDADDSGSEGAHSDDQRKKDHRERTGGNGESAGDSPMHSQGTDTLDEILGYAEKSAQSKMRSSSNLCLKTPHNFSGTTAYYLRTPNFIKINALPFTRETHNVQSEKVKFGKATSVIRWRYRQDNAGNIVRDSSGQPLKQSNARLVKWSDGTYQCIVGNEVFKIETPILQNW
jgi:RNA polymerase-associated protein LEO1